MTGIQEAMSKGAALLAQASEGQSDPSAFGAALTELLQTPVAARGFMAALATGEIPGQLDMRRELLAAIKANKKTTYDLILKNIVMPLCAAQEHDRQGLTEQASLSRKTSANTVELVGLLADSELTRMAGDLLTAIDNYPDKSQSQEKESGNDDLQKWYDFFERWHYSKEALLAAREPLLTIREH